MNNSNFKVTIYEPCIYLAINHPEPPLDPEAEEKKHWKAMYNLSSFYDTGLGVDKSTDKSIALGNELIAMNISYGCTHLGSLYRTGLGVPKDMKIAESYFYEAAIRGNAHIQTYLGGRLISKHDNREEEGKHLLECAIQQKYWEAAYKLSLYYGFSKNNNRKSLKYVLLGIKNGNEESITSLASDLWAGGT